MQLDDIDFTKLATFAPAWLQITADCLDHRLLAPPPTEESSARGAAIMALLAIGAISAPAT